MAGEQELQIRVISKKGDFRRLREDWMILAERIRAGVFQTHDWQYSWWEQFGKNCELHIVTFRKKDQLVAVFPFFIDCTKCLGVPFCKSLKLIGSVTSNLREGALPLKMSFGGYLDALIDPDYHEECAHLFKQFIHDNNPIFSNIFLDELPVESRLLKITSSALKDNHNHLKQEDASTCYQIVLPESWEEYLYTLSKNTRKKIRRGLREVEEKKTFQIRHVSDEIKFIKMLKLLIKFHQLRWNNMGEPGFFADKRVKEFYMNVCLLLFKTDNAVIKYCVSDEEVFAVELEFRYNDVIYAVQGSFDETSSFSKYSPSKILFYHSIREGIENGYRVYDWLRGKDEYKLSLSNNRIVNKKIVYSENKLHFAFTELIESFKRQLQHEKQVLYTLSANEQGSLIKTARAYAISLKDHFKN